MSIMFRTIPLSNFRKHSITRNRLFDSFFTHNDNTLSTFLRDKSNDCDLNNQSKTFLCVASQSNDFYDMSSLYLLGYFTLGLRLIRSTDIGGKNKRKKVLGGSVRGRDNDDLISVPAYLICQLALNDKYNIHSDDGFCGRSLLKECYALLDDAQAIVGGDLLLVECKPVVFDKFYSRYGFKELMDTDQNTLFAYIRLSKIDK